MDTNTINSKQTKYWAKTKPFGLVSLRCQRPPQPLRANNVEQKANPGPTVLLYLLIPLLVLALLYPTQALADDPDSKSGVSPQVISLPSGPGSIEGIGESFEPDLSTGTASYPLKFKVAPGVVGFEPDLTLTYNGGHPNGPWGMGWKLTIPYLQRQTAEGLPSYDDNIDRFIYSNGEKLVPLANGDYRFENEGEFMRFRRLEADDWEMFSPDGVRYIFGQNAASRVVTPYGIFRWHLTRQIDPHGNEIQYHYTQNGGYAYLTEIRYNFSSTGAYHAVILSYNPNRPDTFTDRTSRAALTLAWRCDRIEMLALGEPLRAYRFDYMAERSTGVHSLLERVTQIGADDSSQLPPFTFTYTQFDPLAYSTVSMQHPPPLSLLNANVDLVDISYDGLPDILHTPATGGHRFYLNRGNGSWQETAYFPNQSPPDRLSSPSAMMADMDGNGQVDLLIKSGTTPGAPFYVYAGQPGQPWEQSQRLDYNLSPSFGLDEANLRLVDANNDKRIDIMLTTSSLYFFWFAHEDNHWSESADVVVPSLAVGTPLLFSNPRVKLGDMTGDRLQDLLFVRDGLVVYFPYQGNGVYDAGVSMTNVPTGLGSVLDTQIQVGDLNNDGLADLILAGHRTVRYWLNRGDNSFAPETVLTNTPYYNQNDTTTRLTDIDGDGATELLFSRYPAPANEVLQYVDFFNGSQPNLLQSIANGLGRTIQIEYQPSTTFYVADWTTGLTWTTTLPFPVQLVSRVTIHDANSGAAYVTDYSYRNGYYDGQQKEFRGFSHVAKIEPGDTSAATTVTRYLYDSGAQEESRKGLVLEMATLGQNGRCSPPLQACYRRQVNQITTRLLYDESNGRQVSYSFIKQTDTYIHENQPTPVQLRQLFKQDDYGNMTEVLNYGQVCDSDLTCGHDEILKYTQYAYNLDAWLLNKPSLVRQTDAQGNFVSETRFYYDGTAYQGLPLHQVQRGDISRQEESLGPLGNHRFIPTLRQKFDTFGNISGIMDAKGHLTTIEYDVLLHTFPVTERMQLDNGQSLSMAASYHLGFGQIVAAVDFNGQPHRYTYDPLGRLSKIILPGDTLALPTQQFTYSMDSPRSHIVTQQRQRSGQADTRLSITYFDGLGRPLQSRSQAENGQFVVEEGITFNARQQEQERFLPYFANSADYAPPNPNQPHSSLHYDPLLRVIRTVNPDGSATSVLHQPLTEVQYDEEDNTNTSPHFDTPKSLFYDGLERLTGIQEITHVDGQPEYYTTSYSYDPLGNLTGIVNEQGHSKTMQYDGLSRKFYMNDLDRGEMFYTYDDASNLIKTRDATGQVVRYSYDAANRPLSEQWLLAGGTVYTAAVYHYDSDLWPLHRDARHTLGQVSYIEDQAGQIFFSYDQRGNVAGQIRRFATEGLEFATWLEYDAMDRLVQLTYPNGMALDLEYNAQALLERIPGFIDNVDYRASGQRDTITTANGVTTAYDYDNRLRLQQLQSSNGPTLLQDLLYTFDQASNIVALTDNRPERNNANDQTQTFVYDDLYRLSAASGTYGQLAYRYDSIGNMIHKSSTATDPRLQLGSLQYGQNGAGPHALTLVAGEPYSYDPNGNLTHKGNTHHTWDYRNRLTAVVAGQHTSTYLYDAEGQRTHQTVSLNGVVTSTLYLGQYAEVRGNQLVQYVFADEGRIAQVTTPFAPGQLLHGFSGNTTFTPQPSLEKRWYLTDHLGSTNLLLDESGQIMSEMAYYPYGLTRYEMNDGNVPYRYTGQELDASGLYYYGARYYDAKVGRFLSVDPYKVEVNDELVNLERSNNLNLYAYALSNPIKFTDPTGTDEKSTVSEWTQSLIDRVPDPITKGVQQLATTNALIGTAWDLLNGQADLFGSVGIGVPNTEFGLSLSTSPFSSETMVALAISKTNGSSTQIGMGNEGKSSLSESIPIGPVNIGGSIDKQGISFSVDRTFGIFGGGFTLKYNYNSLTSNRFKAFIPSLPSPNLGQRRDPIRTH